MFIRFDDSLETGHSNIDDQHRDLIDWCNNLNDPDSALATAGKAGEALRFLARYVDYHFETEERALHNAGYPRLDSHIKAHIWFKEQVCAVESEIAIDADLCALGQRLHFLIQDWFLQHIRLDDKHAAAWLRDHPVTDEEAVTEVSLSSYVARSGIDLEELQRLRFEPMKPKDWKPLDEP